MSDHHRKESPMFAEYQQHDATGLAQLVRDRQVSAGELMEAAIARLDTVNPAINAVVATTYEQASRRVAQAPHGPDGGVFAGVPWLLKDLSDAAGVPITMGSRSLRGNVSHVDVPFVQAAAAAGLTTIGVTNVPEFGLLDSTENMLFGPTRNPWNLDFSAGGSSGGAAAAVAAGIVPMAHGNDGGGSLRFPASHCGLFALKPSRGRTLPAHAVDLPLGLVYDGVVSRSVRDTAAFLSLVESPQTTLPRLGWVEPHTQPGRLRIGVLGDLGNGVPPDPQVADAVADTARLCESLGHHVEPVRLPFDHRVFTDAFSSAWMMIACLSVDLVCELTGTAPSPEQFEGWTLALREDALRRGGPPAIIASAGPVFDDCAARMGQLLAQWNVVLSPIVQGTVPRLGLRELTPTCSYDELLTRVVEFAPYTPMHNAMGTPAMSVPLHWDREGLPIGSHFFASIGHESVLLALAYQLEQARPWAHRRPPIG